MGTTIHFPQSAYESGLDLAEKRLPGADGQARPEPEISAGPGMPDAAEGGISPEPAREAGTRGCGRSPVGNRRFRRRCGGWRRRGCCWAAGRRPEWGNGSGRRCSGPSPSASPGGAGCRRPGQPGIVLVLLLRAMGTGAAAAGAWQGEPQAAVAGLIPYALSLTLLISEASDGMMASFRVVRRLRGGKAAGAGKYLLRTALRLAAAGLSGRSGLGERGGYRGEE